MIGAPVGFDQQFDEAVAWFARRAPLQQGEWLQLQERTRRRAFTVAGLAQLELVRDVQASIEAALASGVPFSEWQGEIGPKLRQAWAESGTNGGGHRLRVIWRNNVQLAYSAGRYHQMTRDAVLAARPFWLYDAVLDSGTTELCRGLHGTVLPASSPWWKSRIPPNHHQCRSGIRTLTRAQAEARGITAEPSGESSPDGWGHAPGEDEYVGDPNRFDPAMWGAHTVRVAEHDQVVSGYAQELRALDFQDVDDAAGHLAGRGVIASGARSSKRAAECLSAYSRAVDVLERAGVRVAAPLSGGYVGGSVELVTTGDLVTSSGLDVVRVNARAVSRAESRWAQARDAASRGQKPDTVASSLTDELLGGLAGTLDAADTAAGRREWQDLFERLDESGALDVLAPSCATEDAGQLWREVVTALLTGQSGVLGELREVAEGRMARIKARLERG